MCGIAGCIGIPVVDDLSVLQTIHHRGPDGSGWEGFSVRGVPIWLGHTRLAILDLTSAGNQPMRSADGRWWISFNGEIYNHLDLRKELQVSWRGRSDTETLVEGVASWGIDRLLPKLNGMFSFAAVDTQTGQLYLARDPFGIKPVYYHHIDNGTFAFASEIGALQKICGLEPVVDSKALQTFLTLRYVPGPATLYEGIFRLQPGHLLTCDIEKCTISTHCYIKPSREHFKGTIDDAVTAYLEVFRASVSRQLLSDVPVGVLMSGGIDSALVGAMATACGSVVPAYTVGFGGSHTECEIADAAETARVIGIPHSYVTVSPDDLWAGLELCTRRVEEPLGTTSILPMWYLAEHARSEVKVVLTGQGSDEPWGGYRRYQGELIRKHLPFPQIFNLIPPFLRLLPKLPEYAHRAIASMPIDNLVTRFEAEYALFTEKERRELTGTSQGNGAYDAIDYWLKWVEPAGPITPTEKMMRIDTRMNLADDLLLYGDKVSMAHSLEARVPMLDIELVRFIESLPLNYRISLNRTKIVHKLAARRFLPEAIINRPKKAFQVPFSKWSRGVWKERIAETLLGGGPHLGILDRSAIEKLWQQHVSGRRNFDRQIFALLTLALSLRVKQP